MFAIAVSLLLPAALRSRAVARNRQQCRCQSQGDRIGSAQLSLRVQDFASWDTAEQLAAEETASNQGRLGPLVPILPFIEQQTLWEEISNPSYGAKTKRRFPAMGPAPWYDPGDYRQWASAPSMFLCPENNGPVPEPVGPPKVVMTLAMPPGTGDDSDALVGMMANYVACFGDGTHLQGEPPGQMTRVSADQADQAARVRATSRGMFSSMQTTRFRDCLDGLSNTLLYSETVSGVGAKASLAKIVTNVPDLSRNPSLCLTAHKDANAQWWDVRRGERWCDGSLAIMGFQTVLPPNSPSCLSENGIDEPVASASSHHAGGIHVLFADGRVAFAADEIDCGDSAKPGVSNGDGYTRAGSQSPYGIWGALGSRAAKEIVYELPGIKPVGFLNQSGSGDNWERWTDSTGEIDLTAKFVRLIDKVTVELEDTTGILHRVPLNTLSDADIIKAVELSFINEP